MIPRNISSSISAKIQRHRVMYVPTRSTSARRASTDDRDSIENRPKHPSVSTDNAIFQTAVFLCPCAAQPFRPPVVLIYAMMTCIRIYSIGFRWNIQRIGRQVVRSFSPRRPTLWVLNIKTQVPTHTYIIGVLCSIAAGRCCSPRAQHSRLYIYIYVCNSITYKIIIIIICPPPPPPEKHGRVNYLCVM